MKTSFRHLVGAVSTGALLLGMALPLLAGGGQVTIKGSDTILPLASAWAEAYMNKHPNASISVTGGGSGVGFASLIAGACDIADASREVSSKEIGQARNRNLELKATTVAKDGLAIIVNPANPIKEISMADIAKLYSGAQNWKEIGGENMKIVAASRDSSSGTYVFFQGAVLHGKRYRPDMLTLPSNNAICQSVAQDKGAVGYVGLAYAKEFSEKHKVKMIPVAGIPASDETVRSGKYPLWRPLYNYTNGRPGGVIGDYLKFVTSPEGQAIVSKVGYVPR
jgi:phosphate transport system substrate-binding protein